MKQIRVLTLSGIFTILCMGLGGCADSKATDVRPPAADGRFYPSDPEKLKQAIQQFLQNSPFLKIENPVAIMAPHAGYIYSGQICADAYRQVMGRHYDTIIILGVNHTSGGFSGVSLGNYTHFRTPLGNVPVDEEIAAALLAQCKDCTRDRAVHISEHSIEVQVPFVQVLFPNAKIVPVVLHPPDLKMCARFGQALAKTLKGRRALIVISSDLSHYPDSENASQADRETLEAIATLDPAGVASLMRVLDLPNLDTRACGEASILAGITAAKGLGATRALAVSYANSGETPLGERSRAVGYGAMVFSKGPSGSDTRVLNRQALRGKTAPLQDSEKKLLLKMAREAIRRYFATETIPTARNLPARMGLPQGAFVTLKKNGKLRGCIGVIVPDFELGKAVAAMAYSAAFDDRRFMPLQMSELDEIEIEISVLTPLKPIDSPDEIIVGRDGVRLLGAGKSAVLLPQVATENNWGRTEMLENLCTKAGLPAGCWKGGAKLQTFQAEVFTKSRLQ